MRVTAEIVELKLDSLNQECPKADIRKNVSVSLDEHSAFTKMIKMLLVDAIYRKVEKEIIGDSIWKIEGIENIKLEIRGKFDDQDTLWLP